MCSKRALSYLLLQGLLFFTNGSSAADIVRRDDELLEDTAGFESIAFGNTNDVSSSDPGVSCKVGPWDKKWPSQAEWARLNATLGGALIHTVPQGAVCYPNTPYYNETLCAQAATAVITTGGITSDPSNVVFAWLEGETCDVLPDPTTNCTIGGFPTYVINATTVKHVQLGVNFARNNNIRIIIKNSGHDFGGRSVGAGSLSIWIHNFKGIEYLQHFSNAQYQGQALRLGAGTQGYELYNFMAEKNITVVAPGESTVAVLGGFSALGGHSSLTSYYGLGSDQIVEIDVVTADGKYLTADSVSNSDLFYALRGGGGSTYGVVTSAVYKAYPPISIQWVSVSWFGTANATNSTVTPEGLIVVPVDTFFAGIKSLLFFSKNVSDAGGIGFSYTTPPSTPDGFFAFTGAFELPAQSDSEAQAFVAPWFAELESLGIPITSSNSTTIVNLPYGTPRTPDGDAVGEGRFLSRLFPRTNWEDPALWDATFAAIRSTIEDGGYTMNAIPYSPTEKVAGFPDNAVNPAFRTTLLHAIFFDFAPVAVNGTLEPAATLNANFARLNSFVQKLRDLTPGSGSYLNENDVQEPNWQQSFYGSHYEKLVAIKKARDPWGLFWAPTTPGSEAWHVVTPDGLPTQNGPLCRA